MTAVSTDVRELASQEYQYGFTTDIDTELIPRGLSEDVIRLISAKKNEPEWMLDWRLQSYRHWLTLDEPSWQNVRYAAIDYQDIIYYAAPKPKKVLASLDEVDPEVLAMFDKLGISLAEQERLSGVAVDAIVDSVSVATTFKHKLADVGVIETGLGRWASSPRYPSRSAVTAPGPASRPRVRSTPACSLPAGPTCARCCGQVRATRSSTKRCPGFGRTVPTGTPRPGRHRPSVSTRSR